MCDGVIDIAHQEKLPNLEPRSTDGGSEASEMTMQLEALATTVLTVEQEFNIEVPGSTM